MVSKTFDPKALLERHGWKFGSGLGKDEGGIKEAIKVDLKMDRAGMGYDASEKYSFQWWDHVFNTAANSIEVVSDENGVSIKKTSTVDVSTKKQSKRQQMKPKTYGCFVKSATLTNGGIEVKDSDSDSSSDGDSDVGVISKMTDEELFKACGGMTGHKGARHGLNLRGKLLRIQQHDEEFLLSQRTLNASTSNRSSAASVLENTKTASQGNGIKVEKLPLPSNGQDKMNVVSLSGQEKSARKQNKKQKDSEESKDETKENANDVDVNPSTTETITTGKNKNRRKRDDLDAGEIESNNREDEEITCPKLRKKKRNRECDDDLPNEIAMDKEIVSFDEPETDLKKLKKGTKHKESNHGDNESLVNEEQSVDQNEEMSGNSKKKSKKLKKKKRQENEEKEQQESAEKEPLSNENQTEATEMDGGIEQSKKKEKKSRDEEAMTDLMDQPVEDASVQIRKCKKSKKSGNRKEASMNEIVEHTQECNTSESKLQNKKCKKSKNKEQYKKDKIVNQTEELAAHESKSRRIKCKNAKKRGDETEAVLPALESADRKKDSKTASTKSKKCKRKREDKERNLKECDSETCTSSDVGLENHTLQPKAKRQKNSCVDSVGKTNHEIDNTSH